MRVVLAAAALAALSPASAFAPFGVSRSATFLAMSDGVQTDLKTGTVKW